MRHDKTCDHCGTSFTSTQPKARFCSRLCAKRFYYVPAAPKTCVLCGAVFMSKGQPAAKFCSEACGKQYRRAQGRDSTEDQYRLASGNWKKYYTRRLGERRRRLSLTVQQLLDLHEKQDGRCALTGKVMTCRLVRGERCLTNASIDRVQVGGPYTIDNIQLVCAGVNRWRGEIPLEEFVEWCALVVETANRRKENGK